MAATGPIHDDIHRFVALRAVNLPERGALQRRFVRDGLPDNYADMQNLLGANAQPQGMLLVDIPAIPVTEKRVAEIVRVVATFRKNSPYRIDSLKPYVGTFINLREASLWHRDHNQEHETSTADFRQEVEDALGKSCTAFLNDGNFLNSKIALWENLIAEYFVPTSSGGTMANLVDNVRWYWIIEKLADERLSGGQAIYEAMHATVLLPLGIEAEQPVAPEEPETRKHEEKEKGEDHSRQTDLAIRELEAVARQTAIKTQYGNVQRPKDDGPQTHEGSLPVMTATQLKGLSKSTLTLLDSLEVQKERAPIGQMVEQLRALSVAKETGRETVPYIPMVSINGRAIRLDRICDHYTPPDPCKPYDGGRHEPKAGKIRTPGIADLKVIRTVLLKYDRGELAHVENVLQGETKTREFNTMTRNEVTLMTEDETSSDTLKETQSTDRFELERAISSITKEDTKLDTGVKVTAKLGPVEIDTHFNFQYNLSKEDSNKVSTKSAQELINKASSRIIERHKSQRTETQIVQIDDKHLHVLLNNTGNNIHGLYYWIDKYYLAKVVNYGKRLMFEFVVPEPAAFYLFSKQHENDDERQPPVPLNLVGLNTFTDITAGNYGAHAARYGAADVTPPPADYVVIGASFEHDKQPVDKEQDDKDKEDAEFSIVDTAEKLKVPAGYLAHHADIAFAIAETTEQVKTGRQCDNGIAGSGFFKNCWDTFTTVPNFHILIGNRHLRPGVSPLTNVLLNTEDTIIPFAIKGRSRHFAATVEVVCYRTEKRLREWQMATFNAIVSAFNQRVAEYQNWKRGQEVDAGVQIEGQSADLNRRVEKEELKKHCIEIMSAQRFETFDAMKNNVAPFGYPEFSFAEAFDEGNFIQFLEQAFEWEQITYTFYPYFWGRKPNWIQIKKLTDPDPIFTNFLQAGAARVLVPARPGFEHDVIVFIASGGKIIWGGKQAPIPGSSKWISIVDELKEQEGQFTGGAQEGDPWIYKLPTTLVYLDDINAKLLDNSAKYPNDVAAASKSQIFS